MGWGYGKSHAYHQTRLAPWLIAGTPLAVTKRESFSSTLRSRSNFRDLVLQPSWEMFYCSRCVPLWGWVCLVKTIPGPPGCRSEPSGPSGCCKPWFPDTRSQTGHTYDLDAWSWICLHRKTQLLMRSWQDDLKWMPQAKRTDKTRMAGLWQLHQVLFVKNCPGFAPPSAEIVPGDVSFFTEEETEE